MFEQLLVKHVVAKIHGLLVDAEQLPIIAPGIVAVHRRAAVACAGAVVPLAIDVEFVFANLIAGVAGIFVLQSNQHTRCEQIVSTRCEFIANEKFIQKYNFVNSRRPTAAYECHRCISL